MKLKQTLTVILAALMLAATATSISADDPAEEPIADNAVTESAAEAVPDETVPTEITLTPTAEEKEVSAVASVKNKFHSRVTTALVETQAVAKNIFDGKSNTALEVAFPEEEEKTVTVYTALQSPAVIDSFALMLKLPEKASVEIKVYASNDPEQKEWTDIKVLTPEEEDQTSAGFTTYKLEKFVRKFSFYRFEFTLKDGNSFSIVELQPFGEYTPEMKYDIPDGEVEYGTIPPLVAAEEEKNSVIEKRFKYKAMGAFDTFIPGL